MNIQENQIIGELVAQDYRSASIFKKHGLDFCCQGNRTINEACEAKNISTTSVVTDLNAISQSTAETTTDYRSWDLDLLADYIQKKHHRYVTNKIPELKAYLNKIAKVHVGRHPELLEVDQLFSASAFELLSHMKREETILFPYVRNMIANPNAEHPEFGTIENPIQMMMNEHTTEGERFRQIAELTDNYTPPSDACATYKVAFALLKEFEEDLHLHIHLENNILFPRAIAMEQQLNYA
jgi:regulator of cell morphogenesis and NO signaling